MAQESLRRHVLRVLRIWRSWFIFSDDFLNGLQVPLPCNLHVMYKTDRLLNWRSSWCWKASALHDPFHVID